MRLIKFRVWHKSFEQFLRDDEWFIDFNGQLRFWDIYWESMNKVNENLYVIQQFTGFKDKNEKDIYEGDIFKGNHCKSHSVTFEDGNFFCEFKGHKLYHLCDLFKGGEKPKIIGNILENPKLL